MTVKVKVVAFWGAENVLYLELGGGCTGIRACKNLPTFVDFYFLLYVCLLQLKFFLLLF